AGLERMTREGAPAGADLEHSLAGAELAFLNRPIEFALERLGQRFIVIAVNALAIGRKNRIEKAQEQLGIDVVVGSYGALVGIDLAEQERLDETPGCDQGVTVVEEAA